MHRPNPVQTVAQQRQQFGLRQIQQPPVERAAEDDLAQEIYARLVATYLEDLVGQPNDEHLRGLAANAQAAARAYFESMGVQLIDVAPPTC